MSFRESRSILVFGGGRSMVEVAPSGQWISHCIAKSGILHFPDSCYS